AAKQAQGLIGLLPAFRRAAGPDLAGDYRPISATLEGLRQHLLRSAIHRRRVEEIHADRQRFLDDASSILSRVERLPGAHPDDRHLQRGLAELTSFQRAAWDSRSAPARSDRLAGSR